MKTRYIIPLLFIPPFLLGIVGLLFTRSKLETMEQIRGIRPGAVTQMEVVRQKREDSSDGPWWIAITNVDVHQPGNHRLNLKFEAWQSLKVGDPIEIVYLPPSRVPYTRDGIYADDGNFAVDYILMAIEIMMIAGGVIGVVTSLMVIGVLALLKREQSVKV